MTQLPSFPSTNMSHHFPTGLAAMPAAKSQCTPHFSGQDDEILTEFLREYEDLAVGNGLTEQQKVETILCYVPHSPCNLWVTLPAIGLQDGTISDLSLISSILTLQHKHGACNKALL